MGHQGCLTRFNSYASSHACLLLDSMRDNRMMKIQSHEVSCIWVQVKPACKCVHVNVSAMITEAEYVIVIGNPVGHHTPRVETFQPTQLTTYLPDSPLSSTMVPSRNSLIIIKHISHKTAISSQYTTSKSSVPCWRPRPSGLWCWCPKR